MFSLSLEVYVQGTCYRFVFLVSSHKGRKKVSNSGIPGQNSPGPMPFSSVLSALSILVLNIKIGHSLQFWQVFSAY